MAIYLGLGSNIGDRRVHLRAALVALEREPIHIRKVSPVVESPALLPADASPDWNRPFLNLVAECISDLTPDQLLGILKNIEEALGRTPSARWSPRPIDIDILLYDDHQTNTAALTIPHPDIAQRAFVLSPLVALNPLLRIPGFDATVIELSAAIRRIPLWMGIINLTPDSFSDGGELAGWRDVEARIDEMTAHGAQLLDIGAESTRPGAKPLSADEEWNRLEPILGRTIDKFGGDPLRPRLSIDTYHVTVAQRALALGVDMINDVSGLTQSAMIDLAADSQADFVAMHNLGLPADSNATLDTNRSAVAQIEEWLDTSTATWQAAGIDFGRIVFDPGIGFGKNPVQSLELLRNIDRFNQRGLRLLVGQSRKSFMKPFAGDKREDRDLITVGASMALCEHGVDILRVHHVQAHSLAYRGWAHLQS